MELLNLRGIWDRFSSSLRTLSPLQHIVVAAATYFFLFTVVKDTLTCLQAPLCSLTGIGAFLMACAVTSVGILLPYCFIILLYSQFQQCKDQIRRRQNIIRALSKLLVMSGGVFVLFAFLVIGFTIAEIIFPVTVIPFVTAASAVVLVRVGAEFPKRVPAGQPWALIAMFVLLILSVRYVDLASSKPFTRHLFQVHRGMTGAEVERIMGGHLKNWVQPESEHYLHLNPNFTGEAWYRHTTEGWGNADWGKVVFKDGRAIDAEVCICD